MPAKQTSPLPSNFSVQVRISYDEKLGFKGTLSHKVVDVKDYKTDLTGDETNLILAVVVRASKGEVSFDPEPKNLLVEWKNAIERAKQQEEKDARTLDAQEARITQLEEQLAKEKESHQTEMNAAKRASENAVERIKELTGELKAEREKNAIQPVESTPPAAPVTAKTPAAAPPATETPAASAEVSNA